MFGGFWNAPISLKFIIGESHPFLSLSLRNAPLTQRWTTKSRICAWYVNGISNKMIPLSLNGSMNINFMNDHCSENTFARKIPKQLHTVNRVMKRAFSLICSDLSLTMKNAPFSVNSWTCMLTHNCKCSPPGYKVKVVVLTIKVKDERLLKVLNFLYTDQRTLHWTFWKFSGHAVHVCWVQVHCSPHAQQHEH